MRSRGYVLVGCVTVLASAACAGSPGRDDVSSAARVFTSAVERGDGAAACRLLTTDAEKSVSGTTDVPCKKAITSITEHGHALGRVEVWGDAAQVHVAGDVLFLRRISGHWRVSAAGCQPQPKGPYDCKVGG